jgi:hypothetical protein
MRISVFEGQLFTDWTVVREVEPRIRTSGGRRIRFALCRCSCGTEKEVAVYDLQYKKNTSCGCEKNRKSAERIRAQSRTHGKSKVREYPIWINMRDRCNNPSNKAYPYYGGRGVRVCERWASFQHFFEDMGSAPDGWSIDRIDVNGNYEPGNCRWADIDTQSNNRRNNLRVIFRGENMTLTQAAKAAGVNCDKLRHRIVYNGMTLEEGIEDLMTSTETIGQICRAAGVEHHLVYNRVKRKGMTPEGALADVIRKYGRKNAA